jgi:hypothetical protein
VDPGALVSAEARANVWRFVRGTFPPDLSPAFLRLMAVPVLETIQISVAGTALAVLIGLPLGIVATSTLTWSGVLHERRRQNAAERGHNRHVYREHHETQSTVMPKAKRRLRVFVSKRLQLLRSANTTRDSFNGQRHEFLLSRNLGGQAFVF